MILMLVGPELSLAPAPRNSLVQPRVTLGMMAWVRICRLAQQSLVLCDTKEKSIPRGGCLMETDVQCQRRASRAAGGTALERARSQERGWDVDERNRFLLCKQLCFCHLCFYQARVTLFMSQQQWLLSAPLWE